MIKINELSGSKSVLQNLTEKEAGSITGGIGSSNAVKGAVAANNAAMNSAVMAANNAAANSAAIAAMAANSALNLQSWRMVKAVSSQIKA